MKVVVLLLVCALALQATASPIWGDDWQDQVEKLRKRAEAIRKCNQVYGQEIAKITQKKVDGILKCRNGGAANDNSDSSESAEKSRRSPIGCIRGVIANALNAIREQTNKRNQCVHDALHDTGSESGEQPGENPTLKPVPDTTTELETEPSQAPTTTAPEEQPDTPEEPETEPVPERK